MTPSRVSRMLLFGMRRLSRGRILVRMIQIPSRIIPLERFICSSVKAGGGMRSARRVTTALRYRRSVDHVRLTITWGMRRILDPLGGQEPHANLCLHDSHLRILETAMKHGRRSWQHWLRWRLHRYGSGPSLTRALGKRRCPRWQARFGKQRWRNPGGYVIKCRKDIRGVGYAGIAED